MCRCKRHELFVAKWLALDPRAEHEIRFPDHGFPSYIKAFKLAGYWLNPQVSKRVMSPLALLVVVWQHKANAEQAAKPKGLSPPCVFGRAG